MLTNAGSVLDGTLKYSPLLIASKKVLARATFVEQNKVTLIKTCFINRIVVECQLVYRE